MNSPATVLVAAQKTVRHRDAVQKEREGNAMSVNSSIETGIAMAPRRARRFAAIVDLENLAIVDGARISVERMQRLLAAVEPRVVGMPVRVATGSNILRHYATLLPSGRWGLTLVPSGPDAADAALCDAALEFAHCGVTDLVVVGGDHAYVPLARYARLHVVSHADHLSRQLRLASTSVTLLPDVRPTGHRVAG